MANRIMYKDQVLIDFDTKRLETLIAQSGSLYPESNHIYRQAISSNTNIVLPTTLDDGFFNQIIMQIEISNSATVGLGTTYGYGTIPTLANGKYKLIYDYDGANWVVEVKTEQ